MKTKVMMIVGVVAIASLTACGSDKSNSSGSTATTPISSTASTTSNAAAFNDADVKFLQSMIPHHQQAVQMAEFALDPAVGASQKVVDLATRIQAAQDPEIQTMTTWLKDWGTPTTMDTSGGMSGMGGMDGMMSDADMTTLKAAKGAGFDKMWLTMMVEHHTGAISMAQSVTAKGKNTDVRALAQMIITGQQSEVVEMKSLLAA